MRPLRSFLILLIFLACFTGLHYVVPVNQFFPPLQEFIPEDLLKLLLHKGSIPPDVPEDITDIIVSPIPDSIPSPDSLNGAHDVTPVNPLQGFLDSLNYPAGQIRVMYYGDSQIEGDRFTSYLRYALRKRHAGTGPGLFLPLMPVMYTKSIVLKTSSN